MSKLAVQILESLQTVHSTRRTFNDLKPENIMLKDSKVSLIDFGFCKKYVNSDGKHCREDDEVDSFRGNFIFATQRQLQFLMTTRKDDLLSLGYFLIYLLNDQKMPFNFEK